MDGILVAIIDEEVPYLLAACERIRASEMCLNVSGSKRLHLSGSKIRGQGK